jgi:hypothetical protein
VVVETDQSWDDIFIAVNGENRVVQKIWSAAVVQIQCFGFGSRVEAT